MANKGEGWLYLRQPGGGKAGQIFLARPLGAAGARRAEPCSRPRVFGQELTGRNFMQLKIFTLAGAAALALAACTAKEKPTQDDTAGAATTDRKSTRRNSSH